MSPLGDLDTREVVWTDGENTGRTLHFVRGI